MSTRVLIVDDCADMRALYAQRFEKCGAQVVTAADGKQAIAAAQGAQEEGRPFSLILLDIRMPGMDGMSAAREIRQSGYKGLIAAFTASTSGSGKRESAEVGIDVYLDKMVIKPEVVAALLEQAKGR